MGQYEEQTYDEIIQWKRKMLKKPKMFQRMTKGVQEKINEKIPEKAHQIITDGIKNFVKLTLTGSQITTRKAEEVDLSLQEQDSLFQEKLSTYRKTAVVEGAGTGAGGLFLGLADFPLLLSIKMKFLFDVATLY